MSKIKDGVDSHPTEIKFPIQTRAFRDLIEKMYGVHLKKNQDYSPANILVTGELGVLVRIWDKFARLCNLHGVTFPTVLPKVQALKEDIRKELDVDLGDNPDWEVEHAKLALFLVEVSMKLVDIEQNASFDFSKAKEKEPSNEPIDDAWIDMATYAIIGLLARKNQWGR